jgi:hypothetical protein
VVKLVAPDGRVLELRELRHAGRQVLPPPQSLVTALERLPVLPAKSANTVAWAERIAIAGIMQIADLPRAREAGAARTRKEIEQFRRHARAVRALRDHILAMHQEALSALLEGAGADARHPLVLVDDLAKILVDLERQSTASTKSQSSIHSPSRSGLERKSNSGPMEVARMSARAFVSLTGKPATVPTRDGSAYGPFLGLVTAAFLATDIAASPEYWARMTVKEKRSRD